jgi:hypothetical protein
MKPRCYVLLCLALAGLSFGLVQWYRLRATVKDRALSAVTSSPAQRTADQALGAANEIARQAEAIAPQIAASEERLMRNTQQLAAARRASATATEHYEQVQAQPLVSVDFVGADRADAIRRTCAKLADLNIYCEPAH